MAEEGETIDKLEQAVERIQFFAAVSERNYEKPLLLCYSGGKDSDAIIEIAKIAGINFEVQHSHTTADAPETVYHVQEKFRQLELEGISCKTNYPFYKGKRTSMWELIPQKGIPPTRLARYCCEVLKEQAGTGRAICTGVRWAESSKRKNTRGIYEEAHKNPEKRVILRDDNDDSRQMMEHCQIKRKVTCNPIVDWSDQMLWDFLREQKVRLNPLYEQFGRVGCVGCPMGGRKHQVEEFRRWPKFKQMYLHAFDRMIKVRHQKGLPCNRKFTSAESCMDWWLGENPEQVKMDLEGLMLKEE